MGLDSYLEIFTTMFGWSFANAIVSMLFGTGLVWLPFLFMFFTTWVEGYERGFDDGAVTWMVRKLEVQLYTGLFVFLVCFVSSPLTELSRVSLYFTPPATAINPTPTTATGGNTGTTYDTTFAGAPEIASVPAYWYTVMSLSSGMNAASRAGVNGSIKNLRMIQDVANIATISNLALREEIQGFYNECFVPARSRYLRSNPKSAESQAAIAIYGENDVDWMGSHAFRDDPDLYPRMHAERRLPDFPFDINGADKDFGSDEPAPVGSRATCSDWWANSDVGLRFKMSEEIGRWGHLKEYIAAVITGMSDEERQDKLAQLALTKTRPSYVSPEATMGDERSTMAKIAHAPQEVLGAGGAAIEAFIAGAVMMPMVTLMTMMQPLILMVIYMFLPLVVWFSGYDLKVLVYGAVGIFTVKFWSVMWFVARWMDDHLIEAMFPDRNLFFDFFVNAGDNNYKRMMLNVALFLLYIGMPAVWTGMMAWVGVKGAGGGRRVDDCGDQRWTTSWPHRRQHGCRGSERQIQMMNLPSRDIDAPSGSPKPAASSVVTQSRPSPSEISERSVRATVQPTPKRATARNKVALRKWAVNFNMGLSCGVCAAGRRRSRISKVGCAAVSQNGTHAMNVHLQVAFELGRRP